MMSDNSFWACFWICMTIIIGIMIGSLSYMYHINTNINKHKFEVCIAAGNQYIDGNCVMGKSK